jgi:hypothetical protein
MQALVQGIGSYTNVSHVIEVKVTFETHTPLKVEGSRVSSAVSVEPDSIRFKA